MLTPAQTALLLPLSECRPGRGVLVSRRSPDTATAFSACLAHGWVEEVVSGPLRVWKITTAGRTALQTAAAFHAFSHVAAEC